MRSVCHVVPDRVQMLAMRTRLSAPFSLLVGANLDGSRLFEGFEGTDLTGASVEGTVLDTATFDTDSICPDGTSASENLGTCPIA